MYVYTFYMFVRAFGERNSFRFTDMGVWRLFLPELSEAKKSGHEYIDRLGSS